MPMIDITLLIILTAAALLGFRKGLIAQAGSAAAIIIAIIACRTLGPAATDIIMPAPEESSMSRLMASAIAYSAVYLVAYYAVILISKLLRQVTHTLFLGPLDRIGGAIVNILKWSLALSLAFNLYTALWPDGKLLSSSTLAQGRPIRWITALAPKALGLITGTHEDKTNAETTEIPAETSSTSDI